MAKKVIRVVAPGRPIAAWQAEAVRALFQTHPIAATHDLQFDQQCFLSVGHFAGTDSVRAESLRAAFDSEEVDVVWGANGGYGACRLLAAVLPSAAVARPKLVAGYSDFGFLLGALYQRSRHTLLHCPMPIDIKREGGNDAILRALGVFFAWSMGTADTAQGQRPAFVSNLSVLTKLVGTPYEPDLAGHDLVLEDVAEHLYAIDRMLFQASAFARRVAIASVGVGLFTDLPDNDVPFGATVEEMFDHWFAPLDIPVRRGLAFGHSAANRAQLLGAQLVS